MNARRLAADAGDICVRSIDHVSRGVSADLAPGDVVRIVAVTACGKRFQLAAIDTRDRAPLRRNCQAAGCAAARQRRAPQPPVPRRRALVALP